jgi:16S rRNA (cytidine1402-2'-O)-methyltransferase
MQKRGQLFIVATPIGHLQDISARAIAVLRQVSLIAAEDTRHSGKLLQALGISTPMVSLHEFNEFQRSEQVLERLLAGQDIALISDAGTPLISDPGSDLVKRALAEHIKVVPIPGPCAAIAALSVSGLSTDSFIFEGFLPAKASARQKHLEKLVKESRTLVFYEAPHRICDLIQDMIKIWGPEHQAALAKELTKMYETIVQDSLQNILAWLEADPLHQKGEFVVMLEGVARQTETSSDEILPLLKILLEELPTKQAAHLAAKITGKKKNEVYELALQLKKD